MHITDTHFHMFDPDLLSYDWLEQEPHLNRRWGFEEYLAQAHELGIEQAIHVESGVTDAFMLRETVNALSTHPRLVGAIAGGRPERADFPEYLAALETLRDVKGIRRMLQSLPAELSQSPMFIENIRRLPGYDLTFDICVRSHELPIAAELVAACPDVQFVLDHCGNPEIAKREWSRWATDLLHLSKLPNVVCKVSGLLANAGDTWTAEDLRPYVEHVIACYGWDRIIWGSDYPVLCKRASLAQWVEATRSIVASASRDEQEKLFFRNAERLFRLKP